MKVIQEAISEIPEDYLVSEAPIEVSKVFGEEDILDTEQVSNYVVDSLSEEFGEYAEAVPSVVIRQYSDGTQDIIGSSHYVVKYNGVFYDYCPGNFNDEFGLRLNELAPVVQPAIYSEAQIGKINSSVKGYYILGERS